MKERISKMKILIWGTGLIAKEFESYVKNDIEILGYIETNIKKGNKENNIGGKIIYSYKQLGELDYDYIIIANMYSNEIRMKLLESEIAMDRVIFLRPWNDAGMEECNKLFHWGELRDIAPKYLEEKLRENDRYLILDRMWLDDIEESILERYTTQKRDYFRYRTFELVAKQIKGLVGNVAEVGVFQGDFAQIINDLLPEKTLYLFDTFESFNKTEYEREMENGNCEEGFDKLFLSTNVEKVLKKMPHPDKCIIRKGYFPQTTEGLEEQFVFASIDVDFEDSIYECLKWFMPRLVSQGILFVHDYNNKQLFGVKRAIERYEKENGVLTKLPIGDWGGTLVIIKP